MSSSAHSPARVGNVVTIAGRSTPGRRPSTKSRSAIIAPEFPRGDDRRRPSPDFTRIEADAHRRLLLLLDGHGGASCIVMTSGACTISIFSRSAPAVLSSARKARLVAHEDDGRPALAHGRDDALHLHDRCGVRAHGVDGDPGHGDELRLEELRTSAQGCSSSFTSTTSRSR
jgi:hypothetical protein